MQNRFKVWDRVLGDWSMGSFMINQNGELREYGTMIRGGRGAATIREQRILRPADMDRYRIARCTGVKSLSGALVYERDIVLVVGSIPGDADGFVGEVKYSEGAWWIDNGKAATRLWSETAMLDIVGTTFKDDIEQWYAVKIPRK